MAEDLSAPCSITRNHAIIQKTEEVIFLDRIERMLDAYEKSKLLVNGKREFSAHQRYEKALEIGRDMCKQDRLYRFEYDDPDIPLKFHLVVIGLKDDQFRNQTEIKQFVEFLELFDTFSFYGKSDGNIEMSLSLTLYE